MVIKSDNDRHKSSMHSYYYTHREKCNESSRLWTHNHKLKSCEIAMKSRLKLKKDVIDKLGGKCENPYNFHREDITDIRVLQIDHINGGGYQEVLNVGGNIQLRRLIRNMPIKEARKKYQVLCANCNWIKKFENKEYRVSKV